MDFWTSGPGWQQLMGELVAAEFRGADDRQMGRARRQPRRARRAFAQILIALAARLDPTVGATWRERTAFPKAMVVSEVG